MFVSINSDFLEICRKILSSNRSKEDWALIESDDMFQLEQYEGGFDASEEAFCFSYYTDSGQEYWFQISLEDVERILNGEITEIKAAPAQ